MPLIEGSARKAVYAYELENLAAGADIADRAVLAAPAGGSRSCRRGRPREWTTRTPRC